MTFPDHQHDLRPDPYTLFCRSDLDADNNLRFAFALKKSALGDRFVPQRRLLQASCATRAPNWSNGSTTAATIATASAPSAGLRVPGCDLDTFGE